MSSLFFIFLMVGISAVVVLASFTFSRGESVSDLEQFISYRSKAGTFLMGLSTCATVSGVWILFLPPIIADAGGGIALFGYAIAQALPLFVFAFVCLRIRRLIPDGHDIVELLRNRFGVLMSVLFIGIAIFYLFVFIVAELTAMSQVMLEITNTPAFITIVVVAISTCLYTLHGGLRSSMFTDGLQFAILIPVFVMSTLTLIGAVDLDMARTTQSVSEQQAEKSGLTLAIALILGVTSANIFHQGLWQRLYSGRSQTVTRLGFILGAALVIPLIFLAGYFGLNAAQLGFEPATSVFQTFNLYLPKWANLLIITMALLLAMSTIDSLISGISGSIITNISFVAKTRNPRQLLVWSRLSLIAIVFIAAIFSLQQPDLLYMFLFIDLICAGAALPVLSSMFSRYQIDPTAFISAASGVFMGFLFFPPGVGRDNIVGINYELSLALSFSIALIVSGGVLYLTSTLRKMHDAKPFDLSQSAGYARRFL